MVLVLLLIFSLEVTFIWSRAVVVVDAAAEISEELGVASDSMEASRTLRPVPFTYNLAPLAVEGYGDHETDAKATAGIRRRERLVFTCIKESRVTDSHPALNVKQGRSIEGTKGLHSGSSGGCDGGQVCGSVRD
jgi:hypothetical protein